MAKPKILLLSGLFVLVILIFFPIEVRAIQSVQPVEVEVPDTTITISGRASPYALVTVKESSTTISTITSDGSGSFSTTVSRPSGIHSFETSYSDTKNNQSFVNKKTLSLQPQQDTPYSVFLSPTLNINSNSTLTNGSTLLVSGYSYANSLISLSLDYGSKLFNVSTDSAGFFEKYITTTDLQDGDHTLYANAIAGADLSDTSLPVKFNINTDKNNKTPDISVISNHIPPPVVLIPQDGTVIDGNSVEISGDSLPNAQINIIENGKPIGAVFSDENGYWKINYVSTEAKVVLNFTACIGSNCSPYSADLNLTFNRPIVCINNISLGSYRYWGINTNEELTVEVNNLSGSGIIIIDWGDQAVEKFDVDSESLVIKKSYSRVGNYNGVINYETNSCRVVRYFSINIENNEAKSSAILYWLAFFIAVVSIYKYIELHYRSKRQKK